MHKDIGEYTLPYYDFKKYSRFFDRMTLYRTIGQKKCEYWLVILWDQLDHSLEGAEMYLDLIIKFRKFIDIVSEQNSRDGERLARVASKKIADYADMLAYPTSTSVFTTMVQGIKRQGIDLVFDGLYSYLLDESHYRQPSWVLIIDGEDKSDLLEGADVSQGVGIMLATGDNILEFETLERFELRKVYK